jgi:hypothetical protein
MRHEAGSPCGSNHAAAGHNRQGRQMSKGQHGLKIQLFSFKIWLQACVQQTGDRELAMKGECNICHTGNETKWSLQ